MDSGPAASPACGTKPSPPSRAICTARAYGASGYPGSYPPMPSATTPRSRYRTETRAHSSASSTGQPLRYRSGVNRTVTPKRSAASIPPSVYPV